MKRIKWNDEKMVTSFDFLKNFNVEKDTLEIIYLQSIGATDISEGELNPITETIMEEDDFFILQKNRILRMRINNEAFYVWSFYGDDPFGQCYDDFYIFISRDPDFKDNECFAYNELKYNRMFKPESETKETFPFVLKFLKFFLDIMDSDTANDNFDEDIYWENLNEIQFLKDNPSIDTASDFTKHCYNWKVPFEKRLIDCMENHHNPRLY